MDTDIIHADSEYFEQEQVSYIVKILYIEDNRVNLRLVEEIIKREFGCNFLSAENPIDGLEIAETEKPTLILLDINLPEMDGYEVVKRLKQSPQTCEIPVVAASANALAEDIQKGMDSGFDEYLTKPFKIQDFASMVRRYLPESE